MFIDKKLKQYNEREERFRLAVAEATANKTASINSIANKYRVSRTTLSRRIHGFKNTRNSHEKQQKFTNDEENLIVNKVQQMLQSSEHIPPKKEVLSICENVLKEKYKDRAPAEGENFFKVGKNWIDRFLERHNDKLMINSSTTLSEYYRSEFLQRKKLRSDRGYKTSGSSTPSEHHPYGGESNDQQSQHTAGYQYQQQQQQQSSQGIEQHQRLPYQSQQESGFVYPVEQGQVGSYAPAGYLPHNPGNPYNQDWQFNNFQPRPSIYGTQTPQASQPGSFAYSGGPIQQQQIPPLLKPDAKQTGSGQFNNPSYVYGSQVPLKQTSPVISGAFNDQHHPPPLAQQTQQPPQTQTPAPQSQASQHGIQQQPQPPQSQQQQTPSSVYNQPPSQTFGSYSFSQQQFAVAPEQAGQAPSSSTDETLQFYQGQRFQYGLVRQKLLKEIETEPVDVNSVTKLINLTFNQIERDLNGTQGHPQSQKQGASYSIANY